MVETGRGYGEHKDSCILLPCHPIIFSIGLATKTISGWWLRMIRPSFPILCLLLLATETCANFVSEFDALS